MNFESLFLLLLLIASGMGVYYYLKHRDRGGARISTAYTEGLRAILDGETSRAIQKLREAVASDSTNLDAYIRLGSLFSEHGDAMRAIKIHRALTFRADLTNSQKASVFRALACDYTKAGDAPRALESLEHILAINKKDPWALSQKTTLLESRGDWAGAFETARRLESTTEQVPPRRLAVLKVLEGLRYCAEKKERDGRVQFREALKFDNTLVAPYLYWGDSYIREDRPEDAVKIWKRLLDMNSTKSYLVFERLESHLFDLGRFSEIEQIYRGVIRSHPQNVHAYSALARFLEKRGDGGDAIAVLREGLALNSESLWLRRKLVQVYGDIRDVDNVLKISRQILTRVMKEAYDFVCTSCKHVSHEPVWQCPQCKKLDTFNV